MAGTASLLAEKISSKNATVCVIGLGYVGVPLTVASAQAGFNVLGVDVDASKVKQVNRGVCYVEDKYSEDLLPGLVSSGKIKAYSKLSEAVPQSDIAIVCVPTPLKKGGDPDLSFLKSVAKSLANQLTDYKLIIVESTSYPGTTEEVFRPLLERGGKKAGNDFALVYSPERIDYGNASFGVRSIPKVVGGVDEESTRLGSEFYSAILQAKVVAVSGPSVAEATKMLENVFRYVNIALVNELAVLHETLGVDFIEAIDAASTKPFGFMAHYPGPGVGGHCIPKDPFYLVYKAKSRLPSADGLGRGGAEQWNAQAYGREVAEDPPEAEEESAEGEGCALGIGIQGRCQGHAEESECGPVEDLPTIRGQSNCFRSIRGDDQSWQCSLHVCRINAGFGQGCGCSCDRDEPRRVSTG